MDALKETNIIPSVPQSALLPSFRVTHDFQSEQHIQSRDEELCNATISFTAKLINHS